MRNVRARTGSVLTFLIALSVLAAPAFAQDSRIEAAKKEGELVFYSGMTVADAEALLTAFEKKYPFITTKHQRSRGARLIAQIQSERRAGRFIWDVYAQAGLEGYVLLEEGHFAAYNSGERKHFPPGHRDAEGYWTTIYTTPMLPSYNRNLVPAAEVPKAYSDLLQPKWKGKLGIDPRDVEWYANLKKVWGPSRTRDFIAGLRKQEIALREGRSLLTQLLAAGEFAILINNYLQNIVEAREKGAPIEMLPLDPVITGAGPVAINKQAPHPNAARLFIDFALSREGQEIIVKHGRTSARSDIKGNPLEKIKGVSIVPSDIGLGKVFKESLREYQELLGVLGK